MSAVPPKADIDGRSPDVRFVPEADSCSAAEKAVPQNETGDFVPQFDGK
jgi:hypothetical protein